MLLFVQQYEYAARRGDTETLRRVQATQLLCQEFGEELRDRRSGPFTVAYPPADT
jgi:hypothetical protein